MASTMSETRMSSGSRARRQPPPAPRNHSTFADRAALLRAKEERGMRISVCLPTRNEAGTVGDIVGCIRDELVRAAPLVDEIVVVDSSSTDGTALAAARAGALVYQDSEI